MNDFSVKQWMARNPLGIIALFISLIYGISALLLGASIGKLSPGNQTVLVWFIVLFPCAVLSVFSWLVAAHHRKLYGPSDFRSDESFLNASTLAPPSALGARLAADLDDSAEAVGSGAAHDDASPSFPEPAKKLSGTPEEVQVDTASLARKIDSRITESYLIEGLIFQEFEREFRQGILRQPRLLVSGQNFLFDGLIQTEKEQIFVEVKLIRSKEARRIRELRELALRFGLVQSSGMKLILAIAYAEENAEALLPSIEKLRKEIPVSVEVRSFSLEDLVRKYGLASASG